MGRGEAVSSFTEHTEHTERTEKRRGSVLTATAGALLITRTGDSGGIDLIRTRGSGVGQVLGTVDLPHAGFVAAGPVPGTFFVLAADAEDGVLVTVRREASGLRVIGRIGTGGAEPCHLAVLGDGSVVVANYTGGNIAIFELDAEGIPARRQVLPLAGGGPDPARQDGAHPHFVWVDPDAADDAPAGAIVVDLGADRLRALRRTAAGWTVEDLAALHPGAGPRHAVSVSGRLVVVDELSGEVTALSLRVPQEQHSISSSGRTGADPVYPGDIVALGDAVAVANRGRDSVAIVELSQDGRPVRRQEWPTGGEWPHQLGWDGERIIVLELRSGRLVRLDPTDGAVEVVLEGLRMPSWALDLHAED